MTQSVPPPHIARERHTTTSRPKSEGYWKSGSPSPNAGVPILIGSSEIAVCARAYTDLSKTAQNDCSDVGRLKLQCISIATFLVGRIFAFDAWLHNICAVVWHHGLRKYQTELGNKQLGRPTPEASYSHCLSHDATSMPCWMA